ncbi:MAG: hypothetical protein IKG27_01700 [Bacilli bacterium]|nr:hypothetical protein [Bacilli bacterium]
MEEYENFLYMSLMDANEEIMMLREIIDKIRNTDLYTLTTEYDYEESIYEVYEPFNTDEIIEETLHRHGKTLRR